MIEQGNSSSGKRVWRYAFLSGIATFIIAAVAIFGVSLFTTVLMVSTVIIGILNSLLGSDTSAADGKNWFISGFKHSLDVGKFLKFATVVVWLAGVGLISYGVLHYRAESRKVTIEGYVFTAAGQPAGSAVVTLLLANKKETVTSADGKFTFPGLDLSNEPSKQVQIQAVWQNHTKVEPLNLATAPLGRLMIKLLPGEPPFRVSYIRLEGYAIDFLVRGQIDKQWEERLGGQPFIVPNDVFNTLKKVLKDYSQPFKAIEGDAFEISSKSGTTSDESLAQKNSGKTFFEGSQGHLFIRTASKEDVLSLLDPTQQWNIEIEPRVSNVPRSLTFWRFANDDDVKSFQSRPGFGFLNYATSNYLPPDFYLLTLKTVSEGGCGDDSATEMTELFLTPRVLKFRVAVLENTSSTSIQLGKFSFKENASEKLRSGDEDQSNLKAADSTKQKLFPLEALNPHEKLLIPLDMPLAYEDLQGLDNPASANDRGKTATELAKLGVIKFPYGETGETYSVTTSELLSVLNRPTSNPLLDKSYIFGPSISIESVEVDNVEYPFRQFDASRFVINAGGDYGSCPFVYTYSSESGAWLNEGHILYGVNSKLKESEDAIRLSRFDGRVLIKENEPEISFIDSVYVRAVALDGSEKRLYPRSNALRFEDGNYLKLRQWEQFEVEFDLPRELVKQEYFVVAKGYYVPVKKK